MKSYRQKYNFIPISLVIIIILLLQIGVTFRIFYPPFSDPDLWPFLTYPMYKEPHYQGSAINQYFVFGTLENNQEVAISPEDVNLDFWLFRRNAIAPLLEKDQESINKFITLYQDISQQKLKKIRLENHPLILSRKSHYQGEVEIINNLKL